MRFFKSGFFINQWSLGPRFAFQNLYLQKKIFIGYRYKTIKALNIFKNQPWLKPWLMNFRAFRVSKPGKLIQISEHLHLIAEKI